MKKILAMLVVAFVLGTTIGCSGSSSPAAAPKPAPKKEEPKKEEPKKEEPKK